MSGAPRCGSPRRLYRRSRKLREAYRERRFHSRIRIDARARALLLSPHLDDSVLDCWSLLASDRELAVVNVFTGIPQAGRLTRWDATTGARDSAERVRERIAEDARALSRAARKPVNLPFLDAQYRRPPPAPSLDDLDRALSEAIESASHVYVPAGLGSHPDHLLARRYGRMLLRAGMPVTLYAELPYCVLHGWPCWVDGRAPDPHRDVDAFWLSFLDEVPELPALRSAHVERLGDEAASAKLEAMSCYATQMPCLDYGARGLLADPEIHRFEVSWDLAAADRSQP
ncbi:MAG TPA: PIG-L family deacetylase [Solirubrobacteraceae bacterium]|nr:PIG-L family deacetylase [Solirubrobacteraceae bacterium]